MDSYQYPVFYACDSIDSKHHCRSRLFKVWFRSLGNSHYRHHSQTVIVFKEPLLVGILGFTYDPNFDSYLLELDDFSDVEEIGAQ